MSRILIVDDEKNIRRTLGMILRGEGHTVREAESGEAALEALEDAPADLVLLDVNLPGMNGIEALSRIKERFPGTGVVMISGQATVERAVEATRAGAFDFLEKPLGKDRVLIAVRNALRDGSLRERVRRMESAETRRWTLVGESPALARVRAAIAKVAPTGATVLVTGESGTGKELVARALHTGSPRAGEAFVKVNCAAIPEELIETELFGCVKGAYTGADRSRDGKFLLADQGTIFLDEIGDMSLKVQAKVLRALQEGEIERVGDTRTQTVDARVIAATNKDLTAETEAGRFREDLFYRLNVVPIHVPPLRERAGDLPLLAAHLLDLHAIESGAAPRSLAPGALDALAGRPWRGNVRELRNVLERLAILTDGEEITGEDVRLLAPASAKPGPGTGGITPEAIREAGGLASLRRDLERSCIEACVARSGGNMSEAARWLGIERTNLYKKMQSLGMDPGRKPLGGPEGDAP